MPEPGGSGPAAVAQLRAAGLLSDRDIVERGIRAIDRSRSHRVFVVEIGGRPAFAVKALEPADDDQQGSPARELAAFDVAAGAPTLRGLLPRRAGGAPGVLILDAARGVPLLSRGPFGAPKALASTLAAWHTGTRETEFPPLQPWPLELLAGPPPAFLAGNAGVVALLGRLDRRSAIARTLTQTRARWEALAVVHGDARLDNWLLDDDGHALLIDWETAGRGDPAWDVAAVVQDIVTLSGAERLGDTPSAPVRQLLDAYAEQAGDDVRDRLAGLLVARLLQRAVQVAAWEPSGADPEALRHVALATELAETGLPSAWT